jgi:hypothetical protein
VLALAGGDLGTPVVAYCRSGVRAGAAEALLLEYGFADVRNGGGFVEPGAPPCRARAPSGRGHLASLEAADRLGPCRWFWRWRVTAAAEVRAALCSVERRGAGAALQLRAAAQGEQLAKVFFCRSSLLCLIIVWGVVWWNKRGHVLRQREGSAATSSHSRSAREPI